MVQLIQGKQQPWILLCSYAVFLGPTVWVDQVAGLTSPTRGNKISTCYQGALEDPPVLGWAPGIGCLQAAVPSIIHCTYYTTIQVGHGGIFQIHGHFGQSCPMTRYCVIEVVNKPYTRLQTPELQARLGTGQPGNAAANHLKPFRNIG